jgi:predicted PolB exonuclease-like 3'-5' exonuclease
LHYRCLRHGVAAPRYWEHGESDSSFRYNNYLGRFHWRHIDVMDVLSGYQARGRASLASVAALLDLPGKLGFSGDQVWGAWRRGEHLAVRRYCETDVLNTWLIYLSFQRMRGLLEETSWRAECERVRQLLRTSTEPHHAEFLAQWPQLQPN